MHSIPPSESRLPGPWDMYEEIPKSWTSRWDVFGWKKIEVIYEGISPALRFARELSTMPDVLPSFIVYIAAEMVKSMIPAVTLW